MTPNDTIAMLGLVFTVGLTLIFRGPLGRAIARRIEGSAGGPELEARFHDLEERIAQGEHDRAELIERLDFAERMLLQSREGARESPMTWLRRHLGLDWFDLIVHAMLTGLAMGALEESGAGDAAMMGMAGASILVLAGRRAWALRRFGRAGTEGLSSGEMAALRLEEMEQRIAELESAHARVAELEERLDFAERYLAQPAPEPLALAARPRADEASR